MHASASFASQALKSGVRAYVAKTGAVEDLILAVIEVSSGGIFISPEVAQKITQEMLLGQDDPMHQLSGREFEVFRLLAEGKKVEVVADMLKISPKTVANYYTTIKQKLGVVSPVEMVRLAIRHGLIDG